jgi:hypothetical protein
MFPRVVRQSFRWIDVSARPPSRSRQTAMNSAAANSESFAAMEFTQWRWRSAGVADSAASEWRFDSFAAVLPLSPHGGSQLLLFGGATSGMARAAVVDMHVDTCGGTPALRFALAGRELSTGPFASFAIDMFRASDTGPDSVLVRTRERGSRKATNHLEHVKGVVL